MSSEILGYVNMAIGLIGIVLTLLSAPTILHLGAKLSTEALPPELDGVGGTLRTVAVLLILTTFGFLLALGMTMMLASVTTTLGAASPTLVSVLIVGALYATAATLALAVYRSRLTAVGLVGAVGLVSLAFVAGLTPDRGVFFLVFGLFLMIFLMSGGSAIGFGGDGPG